MKIWMLEYWQEGSFTKHKFFVEERPPSAVDIGEFCIEHNINTYVALGPIYSHEPVVKDVLDKSRWDGCYETLSLTLEDVVTA